MRIWVSAWIALLAIQLPLVAAEAGNQAASDPVPSAEQIVGRYIDALGGREAIERLSTRILVGRRTTDLEWTPPVHEVVPVVMYSNSSGSYLMVEHAADGVRCAGFDGTAAWVQDPDGVRLSSQPVNRTLSWLANPHNALRLSNYFPELLAAAPEYIDGKMVYVLEPAGLDRAYYALYFHAETGLLIRIGYYTELQDYREVDGVGFPFRILESRQGGSTTFVFDLGAHNLPLDSSMFAFPTSPSQASD